MSSGNTIRQNEIVRLQGQINTLRKAVQNANMNEAQAMSEGAKNVAKKIKNNAMSKLQGSMAALALMQRPVSAPVPLPSSASGYMYNITPKSTGGRRKKTHRKHKRHARRTRRHR